MLKNKRVKEEVIQIIGEARGRSPDLDPETSAPDDLNDPDYEP